MFSSRIIELFMATDKNPNQPEEKGHFLVL